MASHVIDNLLLQNSFGTGEMRGIWDEKNRLQKQLDVERALAEAEGELNVICRNWLRQVLLPNTV